MKKIIIASLLMVSTITFAKTTEPKTTAELPAKEEKVLVVKKDFKSEKTEKKIEIKVAEKTLLEQCLTDVMIIDAVSPTPGAGAFYFATKCVPIILAG